MDKAVSHELFEFRQSTIESEYDVLETTTTKLGWNEFLPPPKSIDVEGKKKIAKFVLFHANSNPLLYYAITGTNDTIDENQKVKLVIRKE